MTAFCKGDYISSLFFRGAFTEASGWIEFLCYSSPRFPWFPLWHSSRWGALSEVSFPLRCELQEPMVLGLTCYPTPSPNSAHLTQSKFSIFDELNLISIFFPKWKVLLWTMHCTFSLLFIVSYLCTQPGAQAHDPEIKSHMFFWVSQAPPMTHPKHGSLGTRPLRNWDTTWFLEAK